jgi:type I restriction enzyme S subunit
MKTASTQLRSMPARSLATWPIVSIGDVCHVQLGKMLSPKSKTGVRPVPYLRNQNVQWDRVDVSDVSWMDFTEAEEAKFSLRHGDLLVCEGGEPGRAAVWQGKIERCCYQKALHRIRPKPGLLHPPFLMYRLWASAKAGEFTGSHGQTTIAHLPREKLVELKLPLPSLAEQERIAAWLAAGMAEVEQARQAAEARVAAAEALPESYLRQAFGNVCPFTASPLIPTEPTSSGWKWRLLTDLARLATGHTPSRREPTWWGGDIQWLQLPDVRAVDGKRVFTTQEQTNALGIANSSSVLLPAETVCMSRTASVGFVTIMGCAMATSQDFVNWICGPELDPDFLMHLLIASRKPIRALGSGATHHSIYFRTVESFAVCLPPIGDQRRIAAELSDRLDRVEQITRSIQEELQLIESLPTSLLRQAFGGEHDAR